MTNNYAQDAVTAIRRELPDVDPELAKLYALLVLTSGTTTTPQDVHDAWSLWRNDTKPDHHSLIPYGQLTDEVQDYDLPYMKGIHRVARKIR